MFMCVSDIDECASTPGSPFCLNGGSCVNTVGGFMCSCVQGFHGRRCETGAPPLLRVELTLWTFRFDAWHRTLNCWHWQLLNSRIVYTLHTTCLLCKVQVRVFCQRFCQLTFRNCTMQDASSVMFPWRKLVLYVRSCSNAINKAWHYPPTIFSIPYTILIISNIHKKCYWKEYTVVT